VNKCLIWIITDSQPLNLEPVYRPRMKGRSVPLKNNPTTFSVSFSQGDLYIDFSQYDRALGKGDNQAFWGFLDNGCEWTLIQETPKTITMTPVKRRRSWRPGDVCSFSSGLCHGEPLGPCLHPPALSLLSQCRIRTVMLSCELHPHTFGRRKGLEKTW
jgi:hypothetical protein